MRKFLNVVGILALLTCGLSFGKTVSVVMEQGAHPLEVRTMVQMFEYFHYGRDSVIDKNYGQLIDLYLDNLDPEHAYFTAADTSLFKSKYGPKLGAMLRDHGDLFVAYAIHDLFKQRVKERTAWIVKRVEQWDLAPADEISFLPSDSSWVRTEALDQFWERRLRNEWALAVIQGSAPQEAAAGLPKPYETYFAFVSGQSEGDIGTLFLKSFTELYDKRSAYLGPKSLNNASVAGITRVGIGAILDEVGNSCVFESIIPRGPTALSGKIHPGDRLLAVRQANQEWQHVTGLNLSDVTELTSGPEGSELTVLIEHPYLLGRETVQLTRGRPPAHRVRIYVHQGLNAGGRGIRLGVVTVPSLYGPAAGDSASGVAQDVRAGLDRLDAEGTEGVVLDLRGNQGGLLIEAVRVAGLFVENETIIYVKDHEWKVKAEHTDQRGEVYKKPVIVLVDSVTASGAEIITGALRDYGRVVVVGAKKTAGSGTLQAMLEMKNYMRSATQPTGLVKMTVQMFYLPNGSSTESEGIIPDIVLPEPPFLSEAASPKHVAQVRPAPLAVQAVTIKTGISNRLAALRASSEQRQAELPELLFLRKWSEEYSKYTQKPAGTLEQLREAVRARKSAKEGFELEAMELGKSATQLQELIYPNSNAAGVQMAKVSSNTLEGSNVQGKTENQVPDFVLHEALRILANDIEFVGQSTVLPVASTPK